MDRPLVEVTGATVYFGADAALDGVDFRLFPGEVHSLMGENGAGKSTLIKALTGVYQIDTGEIVVAGKVRHFNGTASATGTSRRPGSWRCSSPWSARW